MAYILKIVRNPCGICSMQRIMSPADMFSRIKPDVIALPVVFSMGSLYRRESFLRRYERDRLTKIFRAHPSKEPKPAYVPMMDVAAAQGQRLVEAMNNMRAGVPLPAHGADRVCAWCEMSGLCRKGFVEH